MAKSAITRIQLRKAGNFTVEGLNDVYDALERMLDRTRAEALKKTFMEGAIIIRDQAKQNAPVRTGLLKSAIFAAPGKPDKPNALVGVSRSRKKTGAPPRAPHGILIEYGTVKMQARPFLRPAIEQRRGEVAQKILGNMQDIVTGAFRKQ